MSPQVASTASTPTRKLKKGERELHQGKRVPGTAHEKKGEPDSSSSLRDERPVLPRPGLGLGKRPSSNRDERY